LSSYRHALRVDGKILNASVSSVKVCPRSINAGACFLKSNEYPIRTEGWYQYKGYYKMTYLDDGERIAYIYYPATGRDAQYSEPLD
jgi:hypothetical protein